MGLADIDKDLAAFDKKASDKTAAAKPPRGYGEAALRGLGLATGTVTPENPLEAVESAVGTAVTGALPIGLAAKSAQAVGRVAAPYIGSAAQRALPILSRIATSAGIEGGRAAAKGEPVGEAALLGGTGATIGETVNIYRALRSTPIRRGLDHVLDRMSTPPGGPVDQRARNYWRHQQWIEAPSISPGKMSYDEAMERIPKLAEPMRSLGVAEVSSQIAKRDKPAAQIFMDIWSDVRGTARQLRPVSPTLQALADSAIGHGMTDEPTRSGALGAAMSTGGGIGDKLRGIPVIGPWIPGGGKH